MGDQAARLYRKGAPCAVTAPRLLGKGRVRIVRTPFSAYPTAEEKAESCHGCRRVTDSRLRSGLTLGAGVLAWHPLTTPWHELRGGSRARPWTCNMRELACRPCSVAPKDCTTGMGARVTAPQQGPHRV